MEDNAMGDYLNERQTQWKMISMEDNLNRRQLQLKTTTMEYNLKGREKTSIEQDFNRR